MVKLNEWKWFSQHEEFPVFAELTESAHSALDRMELIKRSLPKPRFFIETKGGALYLIFCHSHSHSHSHNGIGNVYLLFLSKATG